MTRAVPSAARKATPPWRTDSPHDNPWTKPTRTQATPIWTEDRTAHARSNVTRLTSALRGSGAEPSTHVDLAPTAADQPVGEAEN